MAEFFKKKPIALRHCLLYVSLQKKSIETSFDDFCEAVGPDVIKKEEFRFWFLQFRKGIVYLDEEPVADLKEFIRNDKHALRVCILYEYLGRKQLSVFEKYKNFCKIIGDNVMKFSEFDFWFYRFLNGEYDLNFERDKDKKIFELIDMPIDIMKNIVENLDFYDRSVLERASRSFKTFSEDQKLFHESFEFSVTIIEKSRMKKKLIEDIPFWKKRIQELDGILKYPKLHLDVLKINLIPGSQHPG